MKSNILLENDYILKTVYKSLPYLIDGITVLIKSQQILLNEILENNIKHNEDNLEISLLMEDINNELKCLNNNFNKQEESNEELIIDISQIKQALSEIQTKLKE